MKPCHSPAAEKSSEGVRVSVSKVSPVRAHFFDPGKKSPHWYCAARPSGSIAGVKSTARRLPVVGESKVTPIR